MIRTIAASRWSGLRRRRDSGPKPKPSMRGKTKTISAPRRSSRLPLVGPETAAYESTFQ